MKVRGHDIAPDPPAALCPSGRACVACDAERMSLFDEWLQRNGDVARVGGPPEWLDGWMRAHGRVLVD